MVGHLGIYTFVDAQNTETEAVVAATDVTAARHVLAAKAPERTWSLETVEVFEVNTLVALHIDESGK